MVEKKMDVAFEFRVFPALRNQFFNVFEARDEFPL